MEHRPALSEMLRLAGRFCQALGRMLLCCVSVLTSFALVSIACLALTSSVVPSPTDARFRGESFAVHTLFSSDVSGSLAPGMLWFLGLLLSALVAERLIARRSLSATKALYLVVFGALVVQVVLIVSAQTKSYIWGDARYLYTWAQEAIAQYPKDPLRDLTERVRELSSQPISSHTQNIATYLMCYPFQGGIYLFYVTMSQLFGSAALQIIQLINALANIGTAVCLVDISAQLVPMEKRRAARLLAIGMSALCLPLWMLCVYAYGNQIGLYFALIFVCAQIRAGDSHGGAYVALQVLSCVALGASLVFKSTFILYAIGMWIAVAIYSLSKGTGGIVRLVAVSLVVILAREVGSMPQRYLSSRTGLDVTHELTQLNHLEVGFGKSTEHISMTVDGLQYELAPGWYSPSAVSTWVDAQGDSSAQNRQCIEKMKADIAQMGGVKDVLRFFATKTATQWCAPDFQGFFFLAQCQDSEGDLKTPLFSSLAHKRLAWGTLDFLDGYQSLVYTIASATVLASVTRLGRGCTDGFGNTSPQEQRGDFALLSLVCLIFTGAGCYLLWEAKGVYVFPFFLFLVPLAVDRLLWLGERLGAIRSALRDQGANRPFVGRHGANR